ncbi:MAG TPA: transcription repressor NadR [Candidatus Merdivicinus intestinigallinarum]|nr:transcription repressor NadR [Candidatus Merdivicinus intestinigallinarum]
MDAAQRREHILQILRESGGPVSASAIAARVHVSRQIVVGDVALLRASGAEIQATPRGYLLKGTEDTEGRQLYTIACCHDRENLAEEMYVVVDNGGALLDVIVEHPVYGQIVGELHIFSRYDVNLFVEKLEKNHASPLCNLTENIHLHTLACRTEEDYQRILEELDKKGFLLRR